MPVLTGDADAGSIDISTVEIAWRDIVIVGKKAPDVFYLTAFEGWEDRPDGEFERLGRGGGVGEYATSMSLPGRTVTIAGACHSPTGRDSGLALLQAAFAPASDLGLTEALTITAADRTLTAQAQVMRFAPLIDSGTWPVGLFRFAAQWRCPDPRRYATTTTLSTTLQLPGGGLAPPLTPPLLLPARPAGGSILADNTGKAPAPAVFRFTGPQSVPGVRSNTRGEWLSYALDLAVGDYLDVDTATGAALLNGVAYRAPRPGSAVTSAFELLPGVNDLAATGVALTGGTPQMSVTFAPAFW